MIALDKDHVLIVKIKHDDKLAPNSDAHFQVSTLSMHKLRRKKLLSFHRLTRDQKNLPELRSPWCTTSRHLMAFLSSVFDLTQVAALFTTMAGERRIRVHTLSLRVCDNVADIFRGADMDGLINALCKMGKLCALGFF